MCFPFGQWGAGSTASCSEQPMWTAWQFPQNQQEITRWSGAIRSSSGPQCCHQHQMSEAGSQRHIITSRWPSPCLAIKMGSFALASSKYQPDTVRHVLDESLLSHPKFSLLYWNRNILFNRWRKLKFISAHEFSHSGCPVLFPSKHPDSEIVCGSECSFPKQGSPLWCRHKISNISSSGPLF